MLTRPVYRRLGEGANDAIAELEGSVGLRVVREDDGFARVEQITEADVAAAREAAATEAAGREREGVGGAVRVRRSALEDRLAANTISAAAPRGHAPDRAGGPWAAGARPAQPETGA